MKKHAFNRQWRFYLGDPPSARWGELNDSDWTALDLPHDWSITLERGPDEPSGASGGFFPMGRGWYRKTFTAPREWQGKNVFIEFEGVYMNAEVWLNENFLGRHPYGYTSFSYDLTPYLNLGEENALRVCVDNSAQLNSRWYSGSGIYRPVWLHVGEPLHIPIWGVYVTTPEVSADSALVKVRTTVEYTLPAGQQNGYRPAQEVTLRTLVFAPDGSQVGQAETSGPVQAGGSFEFVQEIQLNAPQLWSPDAPNLYRLECYVEYEGQTADRCETTFGVRSLAYSAEQGFLLNGQPIKMKGGCVHHDNGVLGAASYPRSEERKVALLKASGFNAIRCAHNPPAPAFLDACDRLGMLVIDEAFDCWREGKNPHDYHVVFDDWWERDIEAMVLRDRNHPSVVVWSIGNEILERDGRSNGAKIARMLAEKIRALDPTRPVTAAINGIWDAKRTWEDTDVVFAALDIGGYNYLWQRYESDHERHPQRIMFGTESFPLEAFENWSSVVKHPYVIGDFVWTSMDYLGESGIGRVHFDENPAFLGDYPWHQAYCGDIDLAGFKRPQSYYRDVLWSGSPMVYIAVHAPIPEGKQPTVTRWGWPDVRPSWTWPGSEGKTFKVDVYSSCEQVELFLNGRSLGTKASGPDERHIAEFEVPYEPGELRAVGYNGGQPAAETQLQTCGEPFGLRLYPDRDAVAAGDLCYISVEVIDEAGRLQPNAGNTVYFTLQGAGEILAVGSGDPTSTEHYRGNQRSAFRGRCLVVLKSGDEPGEIQLRANADGLQGAEVVIQVKTTAAG